MQESIKKLYYSITEAAKVVAEEQHVLRYWEREFSQLRPQKNRAGNRIYSARDMAVLMLIRKLLREERYTVAGAKEFLRQNGLPDDLHFDGGERSAGDVPIPVSDSPTPEVIPQQVVVDETRESSPHRDEIQRLLAEIRAFSTEIRRKTAQKTAE